MGGEGSAPWTSTWSSRSRRDPATSTSGTRSATGSASTGCCSPPPAIPATTASCRTPWPRTATPSTSCCCSTSPPSPAAWSRPGSSPSTGWATRPAPAPTCGGGPDAKLLGVPADDPRLAHLQELEDVPMYQIAEIWHFFDIYKRLEPGKTTESGHWDRSKEAVAALEDARRRFAGQPTAHPAG